MKLLVLAQTPPPLHGQSLMVQTLLAGLPAQGLAVQHVNLALSRDTADIGRWRPGKVTAVLGACGRTLVARFRHDCDTLYYIPAPAKRGALYRDWVVMLLCRPFFPRLVLHWHAAGLGDWLATHAAAPERWLTRLLLGRADLSLVLGEALRSDAAALRPRRLEVLRNGIADPCPGFTGPPPRDPARLCAVFLGLCTEDKGLFDAIAAVQLANAAPDRPRWELRVAGNFADAATRRRFDALAQSAGGWLHYAGFVDAAAKHRLLATATVLLFPTYYSAETQGLVVAEALAHDLPVIATRWRAVHEDLPAQRVHLVEPRSPTALAAALAAEAPAGPTEGRLRAHFLAHCTAEIFSRRLAAHLLALESPVDLGPRDRGGAGRPG